MSEVHKAQRATHRQQHKMTMTSSYQNDMVEQLRRTLVAFFALSWIAIEVVCCFTTPPPPLLASPLTVCDTITRSRSSTCQSTHLFNMSTDKLCGDPPFLAVLTEPDACASRKRIDETVHAIERATADGGVTLVVVRINNDEDDGTSENKWILLKRLSDLKQQRLEEGIRDFLLVVNNDVELVLRAISKKIRVDGVHVKEYKAHMIPDIRQTLQDALNINASSSDETKQQQQSIVIGTSCHSIQSALDSYNLTPRGPDYLFVGTCYLTQSHPEKTSLDQLEGPTLPGRVRDILFQSFNDDNNTSSNGDSDLAALTKKPPLIFAIGGIDEQNCKEPVKYGADGVATIRTVMQADDPREVVKLMNTAMLN